MKKINITIGLICLIGLIGIKGVAVADDMSSQNFKIQGGNFNMTSGNKASQNYKLSDVVGQVSAGVFGSKGYIIQSGFLNGAAGEVFSFSVTPNAVDFGNIIPQVPIEKKIRITIANGNMPGYSVSVTENQPMSTLAGAEIAGTICDTEDKNPPCTNSTASKWVKNATYGFGYRMEGRTVPQDFTKDNFYRPFPSTKQGEQAALVMKSEAKKVVDQGNMTLRLNVDKSQPVGQYRNVLTFTAMAGI